MLLFDEIIGLHILTIFFFLEFKAHQLKMNIFDRKLQNFLSDISF